MKFKNTLLFATLLFSLNVLFFYVAKFTKRSPSSISANRPTPIMRFNFENTEKLLEQAKDLKVSLLTNFQWQNDHQSIHFAFSNPQIENSHRELVELCSLFPYVEILFSAQGTSINGENPKILTTTSCPQITTDKISFHLNMNTLFTVEPKDQTITLNNQKTELRHFDDFWPESWILKSIKFYNQKLQGVTINNYELYSFLGHNLEVKK